MTSNPTLKDKVQKMPGLPGVYLMKNDKGKVIYIGKAKNLKKRVGQYLAKEQETRYQIKFLMKRVKDIDYLICDNEKEALLLENSLIKKNKPRYNIFLKDDKSYVSLKLSKHDFPRLSVTRHLVKDGSRYYGPYASAEACRETADFIYRHFQLRTCSDNEIKNRSRPCLEYQIKRCTAPCVGYVSAAEYAKQVEPVDLFLQGKDKEALKLLTQKMNEASEAQDYEKAASLRDTIKKIDYTLKKQKVVKHGGVHQDLIEYYGENNKGIVAVLTIRNGDLVDSHYFPITNYDTDDEIFENFLNHYYLAAQFIPDEILVGKTLHSDTLQTILSERKKSKVIIRQPKRGEKKDLIDFAKRNAIAQYSKIIKKEFEAKETLIRLAKTLRLKKTPFKLEAYDISNTAGQLATASQVVFIDAKPHKESYRHYKIKQDEGPNDYAMIQEVMERRFTNKDQDDYPDLLIIDGGKGQLSSALRVLDDLKLAIPIIGIAKGQGQGARAKGLWKGKKEEEIYLPYRKNPVILKRNSPELKLLQHIRDESHRFALKYHQKLRHKTMMTSFLDSIKGLGPKRKQQLYQKFKDEKGIKQASLDQLMAIPGITLTLAQKILGAS